MIAAPVSPEGRRDWLRLARTPSVGPVTFFQLLTRYQTATAALDALPGLARSAGRKRPLVAPPVEQVEREIEATAAHGAEILLATDNAFPPLLKALKAPPPILTALGRTELFEKPNVAIVGARNASAAGRKIARDLAAELSRSGYVTVSGLARGIDGEAHAASLQGGTVAVLGGGIDHVYPPQNERLYAAIAAEGLILSESPFGHRATAKDFPRRNRLITGCSLGVVVVEATERSGSLISARTAGEQGRELMAVPGSPLDPRAAGTNRLLREGAALVRDARDVLDILTGLARRDLAAPPPPAFPGDDHGDPIPASQIEAVCEALTPYPMSIDEIARAAGVGAGRCAAILVELELAGEATTLPGALAVRNIETGCNT
ncbi:MAG: DNA-processing protein DprA [Hyphomonadaceae bacterium]|nr:DNA-processing protein DprA [Hyphomonadaceae bacterium]